MTSVDVCIDATDGARLSASLFSPKSAGRGALLIASAMGVPRQFYRAFASHAAENGWHVVTFDYRGMGESRRGPLRSDCATIHDWGEKDVPGVLAWMKSYYPSQPISAVGHSVGGQVLGLASNVAHIESMLTVCAQSGYWKHWRGLGRAAMLGFYTLMPLSARLLGYFPASRISKMQDLPAGVAHEWAHYGKRPGYLQSSGRFSHAHFALYTGPLRALSFTDDGFAPRAAVDALAASYRNAQLEREHIAPRELGVASVGHFGFFRRSCGGSLWRASLDSLARRAAPAPRDARVVSITSHS